jgi:cyclic beta-1,2-glucan synthetase
MYRVGLDTILGFTKRGDALRIEPRVPEAWEEYSMEYRFGASVYAITVRSTPDEASRVTVDGQLVANGEIALVDDGRRHDVVVVANLASQAPTVARAR